MRHLHSLLDDTTDVVALNGTDNDARVPVTLDPTTDEASDADPAPTMRFRADTVDQAIADATAQIGGEVDVIEASRIRRGGVGGFFATDLGVEIVVAAARPSPTRPRPLSTSAGVDAHPRSASASRPLLVDGESFASHFARQMALDPVGSDDAERELVEPQVTAQESDEHHEVAAITEAPANTVDEQPVTPAPVRAPVATARPRRVSTSIRRAPGSCPASADDPAPMPAEVLTGAVNLLIAQLAQAAPVAGSRLSDLKRLRVKLTTSSGDIIEMTADLGGA